MLENPILSNSRPEFKQFPQKLNEHLENLAAPHVDSFNEMLEHGFTYCVQHMQPVQFQTAAGERISLRIEDISIDRSRVPKDLIEATDKLIYPSETRQTHRTYAGLLTARLAYSINGDTNAAIDCNLGAVPIMLRSKACNLADLTPEQMVQKGEHDAEFGGIFIIKGNEKVVRMLLMTRRNFPVSIKRSSWRERGQHFSDIGVMVRCVRRDETSYNNVLHYLNNGTAKLMFAHNKLMSYVPVCLILKVLLDITDMEIYRRLVRGYETDLYYVSCVEHMLRELHEQGLHTHLQCKEYLGKVFRPRFTEVPSWCDDAQVLDFILNERIFIHLDKHSEKFDLLVFMMQKLYQCAQAHRKIENVDSVMLQEVLLPGHLYQKYLLDRIDIWLNNVKKFMLKRLEGADALLTPAIIAQVMRNVGGVQRAMESFLATGNGPSRSGLGLMQNSGLVVMAENINRMRYMSHFRAVHRGSFFTTMRTTEARQLLPDAWGFICPVHTPDGAPCGLLNHLTLNCKVSKLPKQQLVDVCYMPTINALLTRRAE